MRFSRYLVIMCLFVTLLFFISTCVICVSVGKPNANHERTESNNQEYQYYEVNVWDKKTSYGTLNLQDVHVPEDGTITYQSGDGSFMLISNLEVFQRFSYCYGLCYCDQKSEDQVPQDLFHEDEEKVESDILDNERRASVWLKVGVPFAVGILASFFQVPHNVHEYAWAGKSKFKEDCSLALESTCPKDKIVAEIDDCEMVKKHEILNLVGEDRYEHDIYEREYILAEDKNFDEIEFEKVRFSCVGKCIRNTFLNPDYHDKYSNDLECSELTLKRGIELIFEENTANHLKVYQRLIKWWGWRDIRTFLDTSPIDRAEAGRKQFHYQNLKGFCRMLGKKKIQMSGFRNKISFGMDDSDEDSNEEEELGEMTPIPLCEPDGESVICFQIGVEPIRRLRPYEDLVSQYS